MMDTDSARCKERKVKVAKKGQLHNGWRVLLFNDLTLQGQMVLFHSPTMCLFLHLVVCHVPWSS